MNASYLSSSSSTNPHPPVQRYIDVLPPELFHALQHCHHQPNLDQLSYFIPLPCTSPPPLLIPQCVLHLYHTVLSSLLPTPPHGLEWWIHSRHPIHSMHLHFDRDEGQWTDQHIAHFPLLSSVLFITGDGGPTLVVNERTDERMERIERVGGELEGRLVWPMSNTMVVFPGDWLHGVVPVEEEEEGEVMRVTLMINVWAQPLHDPTCITLDPHPPPPLQHRFGLPLTSPPTLSSSPSHLPIDPIDPAVLDSLYTFDLTSYTADRLPI